MVAEKDGGGEKEVEIMSKRKLNKLLKRAVNLPHGFDLARYTFNKIQSTNFKLAKSLKVSNPSSVMIELTNLCNLKCITCAREYEYGAAMKKGMMDFGLFTKIVDQLYPYVDSIGLTGLGETLLYKKLVDAVKYIRDKSNGIIIFISTNAHVNGIEEIITPLAGQIDTLQISIDGVGDIYDSIRSKADFDYLHTNLNRITKIVSGTPTDLMFNAVIFEKNYHQMKDLVELASSLEVKYLYFNTMNLVSTDWDTGNYEFYGTERFKTELKAAQKLALAKGIELSTFDFNTPPGFRKCGFPWNHFYISWDGYVVPCCAKPFPLEMNFGNVNDKPLLSCLNSESFQDFRKLWQQNITPDFCKKCHMTEL